MSLTKYKEKRSKDKTPEPFGGKPDGKTLKFVVQKHDASHLHYDFRLEMDGVLKSWAVPKGPSIDPEVKRLAMMVEDHPYDYRTFEGIIPKGQYGGGTVIVWDQGTYEPAEIDDENLEKQEKSLLKQLYSGKLKIKLNGEKLKGEFALVKAYGRGENGWLLMKLEDRHAGKSDITKKGRSVISKKTIEEMEKEPDRVYGRNIIAKNTTVKDSKSTKKEAAKVISEQLAAEPETEASNPKQPSLTTLLKGTPKEAFYDTLQPMLATLVDEPFDNGQWLYEVKWDGYRAVAFVNKKKVELKSRNNKSFNEKFYPIYDALATLDLKVVLDGEVAVVNEHGHANFGKLQNWRSEADGELLYYVFDILWYNGQDLKSLPLTQRREILKAVLPDHPLIRISQSFDTSGTEFLEAAKKMGLEGIIAKRKDSTYHAGDRTKDWLKIKANKRQEVVIGGYTKNEGTSKPFSSLLVGVYDKKNKFIYTGKVGTGFNISLQKEMMQQFEPLVIKKSPFSEEPDVNKPSRFRHNPPHAEVTWLSPKLICEVSYTEITSDGVMRHPSFDGMRADKNAKDVSLEVEQPTNKVLDYMDKKLVEPVDKHGRKTLLNPSEKTQVKKVNRHELKFTNLNKVFWPIEKITKRDLINYYHRIAPFILPYLKERPQSMNRFPDGIQGEGFYYKDVTGKAPEWVKTYLYHSDDGRDRNYLVGHDEATLLYMANLGCIEMNPWSSTVKKPEHPTFCIIDLDPDKQSFDQVIETALATKGILDDMGVPSYCKTSGSTGLHIYIPLGNKYTYEQSKEFGRIIATLVSRQLPDFTTLERTVSDRKGKLYIDFLQNRPHATIACPYAVRPKPGATVSMPLAWDEVKPGLKMKDFHIFNAVERAESLGDIFKPVLGKGIDMKKVIANVLGQQGEEQ
jgi:bifunctional non-homologous end joining protein LigD